jgi:hyperosmotically inducible protein
MRRKLPAVLLGLYALLALSLSLLPSCTVYNAAVDERGLGTQARDEWIEANVKKLLYDDEEVKLGDIAVHSYEGRVYLVGEYDYPRQVDRAVKLAKSVAHVVSVQTTFWEKKEHEACGTFDDISLRTKIRTELIGRSGVTAPNVDVAVVQCNVVLLGLLGSKGEIARAVESAKSVEGSSSVKSLLSVPGASGKTGN